MCSATTLYQYHALGDYSILLYQTVSNCIKLAVCHINSENQVVVIHEPYHITVAPQPRSWMQLS